MSINGFVLISVCLNMVLLLVMFYCPHCKTFLLFFICDPCVGGKVKRKQNVATFCDLMSNIKCFMDLSANINILLVHVCNSVELVQCHSNTFLIFSMVWMIWKQAACVVCPGGTHLLMRWHLVTRDASCYSSPPGTGAGDYYSVTPVCGHQQDQRTRHYHMKYVTRPSDARLLPRHINIHILRPATLLRRSGHV